MVKKDRADLFLVRNGFFDSRHRAKAAIMEGKVYADGVLLEKAGALLPADAVVRVEPDHPFVTRGGQKLEAALQFFDIDVEGTVALDAGAGVGGFSDCLLQRGAKRVIAVDVGYGDFAYRLRSDPRVELLERTNIRYVRPDQISQKPHLIVCDLSFISVKKVTQVFRSLVASTGTLLCLVKPQFEAGREQVGKNGIVRDAHVHENVLRELVEVFQGAGFAFSGLGYSPIRGRQGNIEFWLALHESGDLKTGDVVDNEVKAVVEEAHRVLGDANGSSSE